MAEKKLKIDSDFKNLIRPLSRREYIQLESNIIADGCRDPIVIWNGYIVDGHNRYEICTRHDIQFKTKEMFFECREAALAWICANQLGRRNISEETRKFLIGKQYECEKKAGNVYNEKGINQYTVADIEEPEVPYRRKTAVRIADENHISHGTVQKYAIYARAMDIINEKEPALFPKILSGQYKISHQNVVDLSKLSTEEVKRVNARIDRNPAPFVHYKNTRSALGYSKSDAASESPVEGVQPSVKNMPEFDPDAEINSLSLTIPSWQSSIERTRSSANLSLISSEARSKLIASLTKLGESVLDMLGFIEEN